jgi:hypothetical protein
MPSRKLDIVLRTPVAVTTHKRGERPDPSLLKISVEDVFNAVRQHVEGCQ